MTDKEKLYQNPYSIRVLHVKGEDAMITRIDNEELYIREKIGRELAMNNVPVDFPDGLFSMDKINIRAQASDVNRKDLTGLNCFTVDGPDTKDIDDAVSISVTENGYVLGVHIADCSAYAEDGSELAENALERGTSIYFPGYSIPMFPHEISYDLCSLTEGADKRVVSLMIDYDHEGNVISYEVCRAFIRSRVHGIYSEVNAVISGEADEQIMEKYNSVMEDIMNMRRLADILRGKRSVNGVSVDSNGQGRYRFNDGKLVLSVAGDTVSEMIIREFMLAANSCMSRFFEDNDLPGFYRTQYSMSRKAIYSTSPSSHESLGTPCGYLRFSSPIRRSSDYLIHIVVCAFLSGVSAEELNDMYLERFEDYCRKLQRLEERALKLERNIFNECNMLYFARHNEDSYIGIVAGKKQGTNESIIYIKPYGIRVIGSSMLSKYIDQEFSVKVMVDNTGNILRVGHIARLSAA